ncbi:MAG: TetR family transcriptional regulator, partial [Weissella cibaria]
MATRKTGDDLTNVIFTVTRDIMAAEGYQAVTFARIARESGTSRTVLYR